MKINMRSWSKILVVIIMITASLAIPATVLTDAPVLAQSGTATPTPTQPDIPNPAVEQIVNLGLPVGNATAPKHLAFDPLTGYLYIFSEGIPTLNQGNGLTVFDTNTDEFIDHVKLEAGQNIPLDLQIDPEAGLLFALWQAPFGSDVPTSLTIIDSQTLAVSQTLADVEAMASAAGWLFTVNGNRLARYDAAGGALQQERPIPPTAEITQLAVDPAANRLYLSRAEPPGWQVDIFEATSLTPLGSYPTEDRIFAVLPVPAGQEVLVVENRGSDRWLHRLTVNGRRFETPYRISSAFGGDGIILSPDGVRLFFSHDELPAEPLPTFEAGRVATLSGLATANLVPLYNIPLPSRFEDVVIDGETNRAFALSAFENSLYVIDLDAETVRQFDTAVELQDILLDTATDTLYVADNVHRIRRLDSQTFEPLLDTQLTPDEARPGPVITELALDRGRNRLYVSGFPARVLAADTFDPVATLSGGGQFAIAPDHDAVYLSNCGISILTASNLISQTLVPGSTAPPGLFGPSPCVSESRLDTANGLLYGLAPNGVPGSNGGNLLYLFDLALEPTLVYTDPALSAAQVIPDPANERAFVRHVGGSGGRVRLLDSSNRAAIRYSDVLYGRLGRMQVDPLTNRLYVSEPNRLLVLDGDSLDVVAEMPLPPEFDYRLAEIDPDQGRLYLIGLDGQLMIVTLDPTETAAETTPQNPAQVPNGAVRQLVPLANGDLLARIETSHNGRLDTRLYRTVDEGVTWTDLSQTLPPGLVVEDVALSADGAGLFVALKDFSDGSGGVYASTDGGQSWQGAMTGLRDLAVNRLAAGEGILLANTIHTGLHASLDGGQTWAPITPVDPNAAPVALADGTATVTGSGVVLATRRLAAQAPEFLGLFRATVNAGGRLSAWRPSLDLPIRLLAAAPDGDTVLAYAAGLWRSTDGGRTWQPGGAGLTELVLTQPSQIFYSPDFAADQTAYLFVRDLRGDASGRLFRATDGGQQWQGWDNPPGSKRFTSVALAPDGDFIFGDDQTGLTRLDPVGRLWAAPTLPADPFPLDDVAASPAFAEDGTIFALSHEHGLFRSTDGGQRWRSLDFGVRSTSFEGYRLAVSPDFESDQTLFIATGVSLHRSTDGGRTWEHLTATAPLQAERVVLSPAFAADQTLLATTAAGLVRSTDGGDRWRLVLDQPDEAGRARFVGFGPTGSTVYAWFDFSSDLYLSTDGGQTWQTRPGLPDEPFAVVTGAISPAGQIVLRPDFFPDLFQVSGQGRLRRPLLDVLPPTAGDIQTLAYTPDGTLLAGGSAGLLRSEDDGESWEIVESNLPAEAGITRLAVTDTHLVALLSDGRIFLSADEGLSWENISIVDN